MQLRQRHCSRRWRPVRQRGITLIETLLGLSVSAVILVAVASMLRENNTELRARAVADQQAAFASAAGQYFLNNRSAMLEAMRDGTGASDHCKVGASAVDGTGGTLAVNTTKHTCALDVAFLKWKQAVPSSFRETNIHQQKLVAIFKRVYDGTTATDAVEMLVVGARNGGAENSVTDLRELALTAELVGGNGGFAPSRDYTVCRRDAGTSTYEACGAQGGWRANLLDFVNSIN